MSASDCLASRLSSAIEIKPQTAILTTSVLGRFIRKCRLEYMKLDFEAASLLWNLFKALIIRKHNLLHPRNDSETHDLHESELTSEEFSNCFGMCLPGPSANWGVSSKYDLHKLAQLELERNESLPLP